MMNTEIDFHLLLCLKTIVAERHVSRAADKLGMSQPAMSRALAKLRSRFNDPIVIRTRGGLVPTANAVELTKEADEILSRVEELLVNRLTFNPSQSTNTFNVVTVDYLEVLILPKLVELLAQEAPKSQIVVHQTINHKLLSRALEAGEFDLSIGYVSKPSENLRSRKLFDEEFVCLSRKKSAFAGKPISAELFCRLSHVLVTQRNGGYYGQEIDKHLESKGQQRRIALVTPHFMSALHIIAGSDLIMIAPKRFAQIHAEKFALQISKLPIVLQHYPIGMFWHDRTHRAQSHQWFRRKVQEVARSI